MQFVLTYLFVVWLALSGLAVVAWFFSDEESPLVAEHGTRAAAARFLLVRFIVSGLMLACLGAMASYF